RLSCMRPSYVLEIIDGIETMAKEKHLTEELVNILYNDDSVPVSSQPLRMPDAVSSETLGNIILKTTANSPEIFC
ncbi:hypothetical protein L9F63_014238, partial [Diploptera punctata]